MGCCSSNAWTSLGGESALELSSVRSAGLDRNRKGKTVIVGLTDNDGRHGRQTLSGTGSILGTCVIEQSYVYWEVRVLRPGSFRLGVSQGGKKITNAELAGQLGDKGTSWMCDFSSLDVAQDEYIGVCFSAELQPMLRFYRGAPGATSLTPQEDLDIKRAPKGSGVVYGDVYPAFSVDDGAELEIHMKLIHFYHKPPLGDAGQQYVAIVPGADLV